MGRLALSHRRALQVFMVVGCLILVTYSNSLFRIMFPLDVSELPRPGVEVVLGGDRLDLIRSDGTQVAGVVSFYTQNGVAMAFAHNAPVNLNESTTVLINGTLIPNAKVTANDKSGVVLSGLPIPENRPVLQLGGTGDVVLRGESVIHPMHRDPYAVTVKEFCITKAEGLLGLVIVPHRFSDRVQRGMSGSPIVQNGVIIAFAESGSPYGSTFRAVLSAEVWYKLLPYLTPEH